MELEPGDSSQTLLIWGWNPRILSAGRYFVI